MAEDGKRGIPPEEWKEIQRKAERDHHIRAGHLAEEQKELQELRRRSKEEPWDDLPFIWKNGWGCFWYPVAFLAGIAIFAILAAIA